MARCFITGVSLPIEEAWLIDLGPAYRAQRELKHRLDSIDRIIKQLAPHDDVQIYDPKTRETISMKHRRVVSQAVAETLAITCPRNHLFVKWTEWRSRRLQLEDKNDATKPENSMTNSDRCEEAQ